MTYPALEPIESLTLQERVYRELKRLLMTGHFAPGEAITIRSLANSLGTSVMPIREALQRLSADQAITALPNKSIRIPELNIMDLKEIREIRTLLEGHAAKRAAENISDEEMEELLGYDAENVRALVDGDSGGLFESNRKFHFLIYRAARSAYLAPMIEGVWLKLGPMYHVRSTEWSRYQDAVSLAREKHVEIIAALQLRDPVAAERAMRDDVRAAIDVFLENSGVEDANVGG